MVKHKLAHFTLNKAIFPVVPPEKTFLFVFNVTNLTIYLQKMTGSNSGLTTAVARVTGQLSDVETAV